jgi:peptidyl-prolyl cis-trans isomerase A (cyclophilin A)
MAAAVPQPSAEFAHMWPMRHTLRRLAGLLVLVAGVSATWVPGLARAGTVVRFTTNLGVFDVDLFDETMPVTVANFLDYVTSDRYTSTIFHRSTTYNPFGIQIIQGGGFELVATPTGSELLPVEADPPIPLEASSANLRGTLAMARTSDPDSATSQWYFNVTDSPGLDFNYAVFGTVIGTGLDVIDTIAAVPVYDASPQLGATFAELPLLEASLEPQSFVLVDAVTIVSPWQVTIDVTSGIQTQSEAGYPTIAAAESVTKTGAGTLVFDAANAYTGPTTVAAGTLEIANNAAVAGSGITVEAGATLRIASGTTARAPAMLLDGGTLAGSAVMVDATTGIASLAISAGTLTGNPAVDVTGGGIMSLAESARVTVAVASLEVDKEAGGGLLDLGAGEITIAPGGSSVASLRADLLVGRNGGDWNGITGIMSSTAAASGGTRAVGYLVAGDGSARVSFAAPGDTNLNGQVDVFDLVSINSGGRYGTGAAAVWSQGDFNYDRVTNVFDLVAINTAGAYGQGNYFPAAPTGAGTPTAVPEPSASGLLVLGLTFAGLSIRRVRVVTLRYG